MNAISATLADLTIGNPTSFRNLTMFPLLKANHPAADYHTLGEALALDGIRVTEVSDAGSVPELKVTNTLDRAVLLLDGEELVGEKQNRVFNLTILVPARTELIVPVSCVEAGRWQRSSAGFARAGRAQYAAGRAERVSQVSASLASRGSRASDQSEVWSSIARKGARMGVHSETSAMADIYHGFAETVDSYASGLRAVENQVGAVFAIGGEIVGLDLFDAATTCGSLLETIVRSYALDAVESAGPETKATATPNATAAFLVEVGAAPSVSFKAVGLGDDVRLRDEVVSGAALSFEGKVVHACAYPAGVGHR